MDFTPSSNVRVLKNVPFNVSYADTRTFDDVTSQTQYFVTKTKYSFDDFTYQRINNVIRVPINAELLFDCNYIMYQNENFGTKRFYGFITNIEYKNPQTTEITFVTDVIQTWYFDVTVKTCFVEREHTSNDAIGANLIDEGLALGEFVTQAISTNYFTDFLVVVESIIDLNDAEFPPVSGTSYGNIKSGSRLYGYTPNSSQLTQTLISVAEAGKNDAIISMYMIPRILVLWLGDGNEIQLPPTPQWLSVTGEPNTQLLDGYNPRNKKLLTYPYRSLNVTNLAGSSATWRYEKFDGSISAVYFGTPLSSGNIVLAPENYDNLDINIDNSISLGNYPICSWVNNAYSNWLAYQNIKWGYQEDRMIRHNITDAVTSGLSAISSGSPTNVAGTLAGNAVNIVNKHLDFQSVMAEEKEIHSIMPTTVKGGIANGTVNIATGQYGFLFEERTIRAEIARSIDGYFDMFGYATRQLKVPNVKTRASWNYVQTRNAKIVGNAPSDVLAQISNIYDSGITFWHNDNIGDYTQNNSIGG